MPKRDEEKTRAFVVADAHGNWKAVQGLLKQEGLHRTTGWANTIIVHLGDLLNCTEDDVERDLMTLDEIAWMFDEMLVGNHEHPYWPGYITKFSGFHFSPALAESLGRFEHKAAFEFGGVLVTHAGLVKSYESAWSSARVAAKNLNDMWVEDPALPIFSSISPLRRGRQQEGGILWSDARESKSRRFSQVFGHTPGKLRMNEFSKYGAVQHHCIDLGAKKEGKPIAGAWIDEAGVITPVTYAPKYEDITFA